MLGMEKELPNFFFSGQITFSLLFNYSTAKNGMVLYVYCRNECFDDIHLFLLPCSTAVFD